MEGSNGKPRILVADDYEPILTLLSRTLEYKYHITFAKNGNEAMKMVQDRGDSLDLLILDGSMPPGPSGVEVAAYANTQYPELKVIIFSGEPAKFREQVLADMPVFEKPKELSALLGYVDSVLQEK